MIIMLNYKNELPAYIDEKFSRFKDLFNKIELEKMMEEIHLTQVISKELSENTKLYEVMFLLEQTIGSTIYQIIRDQKETIELKDDFKDLINEIFTYIQGGIKEEKFNELIIYLSESNVKIKMME